MAMAVGTLLLVPIVDAAKEECQEMMGDENDKQSAEQLGFPWLLTSVVIVLCFMAYLCGRCVNGSDGASSGARGELKSSAAVRGGIA